MVSRKERMAQFRHKGFSLTIVGRHMDLTEPLKQLIQEKLDHISEILGEQLIDVTVSLEIQKLDQRCVIVLHFAHIKVKVQADSTDMYTSIDAAFKKLETKLLRYKSRLHDYHHISRVVHQLEVEMIPQEDEDLAEINAEIQGLNLKEAREAFHHPVVATENMSVKTLSLNEAVMKMDLSGDVFLLYRAEEDHHLRLLYRRKDGNYAVVHIAG
jgi:putative sigma-54 modulation protein